MLKSRSIHPGDIGSRRQSVLTPIPIPPDRFDRNFAIAIGSVFVFTVLTYCLVTFYWGVHWFTGEDGITEWWSVATFAASAVLAIVAAQSLVRLGHHFIAFFYILLALAFLIGGLEEISWGQRIFGWGTPESLAEVNKQNETNLHNIFVVEKTISTFLLWASIVALVGAATRAFLHYRGRVTTADFILPSLVLSPLLLMIVVWFAQTPPVRLLKDHFTFNRPEVPEVLLGMCVLLYTLGNLKRVRAVARRQASQRRGVRGERR
ncbi:MAG: hypothetical protein V3V35_09110 [Dehalococcoidia bacterium]